MTYIHIGIVGLFVICILAAVMVFRSGFVQIYWGTVVSFFRRLTYGLTLLGVGYLLGNAFPTFEVHPFGYAAARENPVGLDMQDCAEKCKDFDDSVGG